MGYSLDTKACSATKPSQMKELDELAGRLGGLAGSNREMKVQTLGMGPSSAWASNG